MANSPAALNGYLQFRRALQTGRLTPKLREQIALVTAEVNHCEYCVSAHALRGSKLALQTAAVYLQGLAPLFEGQRAVR